MKQIRCLALAAMITHCCVVQAQAEPPVLHQAGLQALMRLQASDAVGCTRLLTAEGYIGCAAAGTEGVLMAVEHPEKQLHQEAVILLSAQYLDDFLLQVRTNTTLKLLVKGILVDPSGAIEQASPADKFPQAAFALYNAPGFAWNPSGTGLAMEAFDIPILLLDNVTAPAAAQRAAHNAQQGYSGVLHYAHLEAKMSARANSSTCIQQDTCQPLGGHTIWGAAPPLSPTAASSRANQVPIIMLLASVDSTAFFKSETVGAESAMGSLITLLAVADILGNNTAAVATYSKRLVLTALMGEPWGYMGSKRMLWEMYNQADTTKGLDVEDIQQVLEVGQVGKAGGRKGQNYSFFAHSQREAAFGDATILVKALQHAATHADHLDVEVALAAGNTPGLPPASLSSFLRVNPTIKGSVLSDHEGPFINPYYESRHDNVTNIQAGSLAAAAVVAAQALHTLAAGPDTPPLKVDASAVLDTINQLIACLLMQTPGLKCALGQQFLGKDNTATVDHYVSVLRTLTKDPQDSAYGVKSSLERFIWNFLAVRLAQPGAATACDQNSPCPEGTSCAAHVPGQQPGHCVNSSVSYVPSYSTHLTCKECDTSSSFRWQESDHAVSWEALYGWPPDPMWTESNWPSGQPALSLFQKESKAKAVGTLTAGLVTAIASVAGVLGVQAMFNNHG